MISISETPQNVPWQKDSQGTTTLTASALGQGLKTVRSTR